jgi:hypothetical protein
MVDQEKFSTTVNRLIGYNDSIESLLDRNALDHLQAVQKQSHMAILQLTNKVDELMILAHALNLQASNQDTLGISRSSTLAHHEFAGDETSARLAMFKAEQVGLEHKIIHDTALLISSQHIKVHDANERRPRAMYQDTAVWVEWKESEGQHLDFAWNKMISQRVQKLAILLASTSKPSEFHAPICLGYFDGSTAENDRFGLVYEVPATATTNSNARPVSLRQ